MRCCRHIESMAAAEDARLLPVMGKPAEFCASSLGSISRSGLGRPADAWGHWADIIGQGL